MSRFVSKRGRDLSIQDFGTERCAVWPFIAAIFYEDGEAARLAEHDSHLPRAWKQAALALPFAGYRGRAAR
ncbi:hypothetical protein MPL3356_340114 [Mesorhizobium plurifarium]|uniref:Uncharacterized protein n=1 Tax=Mesorhizobium plurifarium TaxID=69974 RepID=A0A090FPT2_MESPL|nr:hypothetical protein MPL3356_340114 [Mesorhizobium plurifarium]